ncbi:MAG: hypothetical protein K2M53_07460 [Muribaculaceae bacterium]|nr:hypothetical protein [Muribaculaceae bacterium]
MNPSQNLGKSTEMLVASMLLSENREVYLPAVDDHGVDLIVRSGGGEDCVAEVATQSEFQELQVKSVSKGGLFAAIKCENPRENYWFVFYIKDINRMWLINSEDFVKIASRNVTGKNIGKYTLDLKPTGKTPVKQPQFVITNFSKLP